MFYFYILCISNYLFRLSISQARRYNDIFTDAIHALAAIQSTIIIIFYVS